MNLTLHNVSTTFRKIFWISPIYLFTILCSLCDAQITGPTIVIDFSQAGIVYSLLIIFFGLAYCIPVVRYIYLVYLQKWFVKAAVEAKRFSHRFSERVSDVGRRTGQSVRV